MLFATHIVKPDPDVKNSMLASLLAIDHVAYTNIMSIPNTVLSFEARIDIHIRHELYIHIYIHMHLHMK